MIVIEEKNCNFSFLKGFGLIIVTFLVFYQPLAGVAQPNQFGASNVIGFTSYVDQPKIGSLAQGAGVKWSREGFPWHLIETSPGNYYFINQDRYIDNAVAYDINVLGLLCYTPQFYSSNPSASNYYIYATTTSQGLTAWSNFVTTVVNRYKDRIHYWQVWPNVDDYAFWQPVPGVNEYKALLQRAYTAIKSADPTATVITAAMDSPFLNSLLDIGGGAYFDTIAVHNYANAATPPYYTNPAAPEVSTLTVLRLAALQDLVNRRLTGKPIWITEYGWPTSTDPIGVTQETQAAYLIRSLLLQDAYPDVSGILWTDFQDQTVGGSYSISDPLDNYGMLLDINMGQKLSYDAYKSMATALNGTNFIQNNRPTPVSIELIDNFEGSQAYEVFTAGGAFGTFAKTNATAHSGSYSGQINYSLTSTINSTVVVAPSPSLFIPVSGSPARFVLWVRGDGGPSPELTVGFEDATGERFEAIFGLISGTEWKQYVYYLDAPAGTSSIISGSGGNNNGVIDYPIKFTGISVHFWSIASPVSSGTVYIDDLTFESGPSIFDYVYQGSTATVHALWSLSGTPIVSIPTDAATATIRDWQNNTTVITASGGQVTVTVGSHPLFVSFPPSAPSSPSNLTAIAVSTTQINLSWYDNSASETGFEIERKIGPGGTYSQIATVGANVTNYSDTGLASNTTYFYRVRAYNAMGDSSYSNEANTTTFLCDVSFRDVPLGYWAGYYINALYCKNVTAGCSASPLLYCPENSVTRAEMAVFIIKSMVEAGLLPSNFTYSLTPYFTDVPSAHWAFKFIQKMSDLNITAGCTATTYCPDSEVTRSQMAVFITKALGEAPAPSCTGTVFNDINVSTVGDGFCRYIEKFSTIGITAGCSSSPPLYCPFENVTRAQMAVFLVKAFLQ